ncbi:MAG: V-type ATP synthase subunit E [Saccharolobus sp.]
MEFEKLLDQSINKVKEEIDSELKKSLNESLKILEEKYNSIKEEYKQKVLNLLNKTKEEIEGEKARLEVENKRLILAEKEYWINKVYEKILEKINDIVGSNEYREALKNMVSREIKGDEKVTLFCSTRDKSLIESLVKGRNVVIQVDEKMLGGIRIYYESTGLTKDFSLKLILDQVFDNMRGNISDMLFGGK